MRKLGIMLMLALVGFAAAEGVVMTGEEIAELLNGELLEVGKTYISVATQLDVAAVTDALTAHDVRTETDKTLRVETGGEREAFYLLSWKNPPRLRNIVNPASLLEAPKRNVRPTPTQARPQNGCVSTSNERGSSTVCYTNGRKTYESVCTINARGEVNCRSETFR